MKTKDFVLITFIGLVFSLSITGCDFLSNSSSEGAFNSSSVTSSSEKSSSKNSEVKYKTTLSYNAEEHWYDDAEGLGLRKNVEKHVMTTRTLAPTYFAKGKTIHTCQKCGYTYEEEVDALVHTYSSEYSFDIHGHWHACTDAGYETLKKDEEAHDFDVQNIAATYESEGKTIYTCKICNYSYETKTSKVEHNYETEWSYDETNHWHACVDAGYSNEKKDLGNHRFFAEKNTATYDSEEVTTYTCQDCGYKYSKVTNPKLEHNFSKVWNSDDNYHWHLCVDKGFESLKGDYAPHDFETTTVPASFTEQGYTTHTCKDCGYTYTDDYQQIIDHNFVNEYVYDDFGHWFKCIDEGFENEQKDYQLHDFEIVKQDPSFEGAGVITYKCSICGYEHTEIFGEQLEHNYSEEWSNDKTHHWHACLDEGYDDEKTSYALHNFTKKSIPATYEHDGTSTFTCKTCGYTYTALDNEQLEHIYSDTYSMDSEGHWHACLDDGYANYRPDFENHDYEIITTEPTLYDKGQDLYRCTTCGYEYSVELDSLMEQSIASLKFTLNPDGESYTVSRYIGPATKIYIPDTFNGLPVTGINDYIFQNSNVTYLKISDNITSLPWGIIYDCPYLETFDIGNSVEYFSCSTWNTNNLKTLVFGDSFNSYDSWNLTDSLEEFIVSSNNEFYSSENGILFNKAKTELCLCPRNISGDFEIPNTVTRIASYAFSYCKKINSIVIPSSVESIDYAAFQYCEGLTSITFNNNISGFYNQILEGCTSLKEINISDDNPYLKKVDGAIYDSSMTSLVKGPFSYQGAYVVPDTVYNLQDSAFEGCEGLTEITLGSYINSLGYATFRNCSSLKKVTCFSESINIHNYCFKDCVNLEEFNYNGNIWAIYDQAFYNCGKLKAVPLSEDTQIYGNNIFYGCDSLNFTIENNCRYLPYNGNDYYFLLNVVNISEPVIINENCVSILGNAFYNCNYESISIPDSVEVIGYHSFAYSYNLKSITLSSNLKKIGAYAFAYCNSLEELVLPEGLLLINYNVFEGVNLKELVIPSTVTELSYDAFSYSKIEKIVILYEDCRVVSNGNCLMSMKTDYNSSRDLYYYF